MTEPINVPIETDPEELVEIARDYFAGVFPEWSPSRGDQVDWIFRAAAYIVAELRDVASDVPLAIFAYLGRWLVQLPPAYAAASTTTATVTVADTAGYTIPAGTRFRALTSGDGGTVFYSTDDVTIPNGSSVTGDGEVHLLAEDEGAAGNFAAGVAGEIVDSLPWVTAVAFEDDAGNAIGAAGGSDEEDETAYLARLADRMRLLSPAPILVEDVSAIVAEVPGVGRSLAVNLYDPDLDTYGHDRTVTVYLLDETGGSPSAPLKTAVENHLESLREVNFVFHVRAPHYTSVDIEYEVTAYPDVDLGVLETSCDAAITSYLSPLNWGRRPLVGDDPSLEWEDSAVVRYGELYEVLNSVGGVHYVNKVKLALHSAPRSEQDVAITGPGAIPTIGLLTGTVN